MPFSRLDSPYVITAFLHLVMAYYGRLAVIVLSALVVAAVSLALALDSTRMGQASVLGSRRAILQSLGVDSLAILSDCNATRKPADGSCACLSDIPGGYCYHTDCDLVGIPSVAQDDSYQLRIIHERDQ